MLPQSSHIPYTIKAGAQIGSGEIKAYVKARAAPYKCPRITIIACEPLRKSGSGKILKKEIRKQYRAAD